jgi:aminocarboxymuconate-semialdehyde decarboxylase
MGLVKRCNPITIKKTPSEYIKHIHHDTLIFNDEGLRHLIAEVRVSQIVLGTDDLGDWNPEAVDFILRAPMLTDSDRRAILGGTTEKLLRVRS